MRCLKSYYKILYSYRVRETRTQRRRRKTGRTVLRRRTRRRPRRRRTAKRRRTSTRRTRRRWGRRRRARERRTSTRRAKRERRESVSCILLVMSQLTNKLPICTSNYLYPGGSFPCRPLLELVECSPCLPLTFWIGSLTCGHALTFCL